MRTFNNCGMEYYRKWSKDKIDYIRAYYRFFKPEGAIDFDKICRLFFKKHYDECPEEYAVCCAQLNELWVTELQFWWWYDSSARIRNQILHDAENGEYHE